MGDGWTVVVFALLAVIAALAALALILVIRTGRLPGTKVGRGQGVECDDGLVRRAAATLSAMIRFDTVSHYNSESNNYLEYNRFRDYLKKRFPAVHRTMTRELINNFSLLYRWESGGSGYRPILLSVHYDVTPADGQWLHAPFAGEVAGGYICGRGAAGGKCGVAALFEALEYLCARGYVPGRDIYVAVSHDATCGGAEGAFGIASVLEQRGLRFELAMDASAGLRRGVMGLKQPVALVGVAEKGCMTLKASASGSGGMASMPAGKSVSGIVSEAVCRLEFGRRRARIHPVVREYLNRMAPVLPFFWRLMIANQRLFSGALVRRISRDPMHNSALRTTMVSTLINSGESPYMMPKYAEAVTTFFLSHYDSCEDIRALMTGMTRRLGVDIRALRQDDASRVADFDGEMFQMVENTVKAVFGDIIVAPWILTGFSDARRYEDISDTVLRFSPLLISVADEVRTCGVDERIHIDALGTAIMFYMKLIFDAAGRLPAVEPPVAREAVSGDGRGGEIVSFDASGGAEEPSPETPDESGEDASGETTEPDGDKYFEDREPGGEEPGFAEDIKPGGENLGFVEDGRGIPVWDGEEPEGGAPDMEADGGKESEL